MFGSVTYLKRQFSKISFFLLLTCIGHNSLLCVTLLCLLSVCNSFKTCIISVDLRKVLLTLYAVQKVHSSFIPSCQVDRGQIKVPQNNFYTLKTLEQENIGFRKFSKCITRPDLSGVNLLNTNAIRMAGL